MGNDSAVRVLVVDHEGQKPFDIEIFRERVLTMLQRASEAVDAGDGVERQARPGTLLSEAAVGGRLRDARRAMGLSLQQVASRVGISIATLSRIENGKQGVDLRLFLHLSSMLECDVRDLLVIDEGLTTPEGENIRDCVMRLGPAKRTRLWKELADSLRKTPVSKSNARVEALALQVEELLAQVDVVAAELASIRDVLRSHE